MTDILAILVAVLVGLATALLTLALLIGVTMPFVGTLVRYRATYTPEAGVVRLDSEDGLAGTSHVEFYASYFGMMRRVWRIEGWTGLYKGLMPTVITALIAMVTVGPLSLVLASDHKVFPHGAMHFPPEGSAAMWAINFALATIPALVLIPVQVITNRAITTPHTLAAFDARAGLRALLSPTERANPLRLYLLPGVAPALLLETIFTPTLSLLRYAALPRLHLPLPAQTATALALIVISTALVTPLQVLGTRLTLQRRAPGPDYDAVNSGDPLIIAEPVVQARTPADGAPYEGLLDAGRTVVREEGRGVLSRAWWVTALLTLVPLLVPVMGPGSAPPLGS